MVENDEITFELLALLREQFPEPPQHGDALFEALGVLALRGGRLVPDHRSA